MTHDDSNMLTVTKRGISPLVKRGAWMPSLPIPASVYDDLRSYMYTLIDEKRWASRQPKDIVDEIINLNVDGTEDPRFYSLDMDGEYYKRVLEESGGDYDPEWCSEDYPVPSNEKRRFAFSTMRRAVNTYRFNILEAFKEDLAPYIQEALVEAIKSAGKDPKILKIILDALKPGEKVNRDDSKDTPTSEYAEVRDRIGVGGDATKRTNLTSGGLGRPGHEDTVRDNTGERGRPAAGVVSRRGDSGLDGPPNVYEVDGGPYAFTALPSEDDILDYGREYLDDTEEPEHCDTDKLGGIEADEKSDGDD